MALHLLMIGFLALPVPWKHADGEAFDGWKVQAHLERFTGVTTCRLTKAAMSYERGAVVFHFSKRADTSAAAYRVDGGKPRWTQGDAMDLARLGFALHQDDLANPSGGVVRIPYEQLRQGREVDIEISTTSRPAHFKLAGLAEALAAARAAGCAGDGFD